MSDESAPLSAALPGTWRLLSRIDRTASGEQVAEPMLGADPVALLIYDRAGNFAAQFMKRDRRTPVAVEPAAAGSNNSRAQGGYDAYFGTYTVDDARNTVTQQLRGALSPENVDLTLTRAMRVEGMSLIITLDTTSARGDKVTRTLTWERIG